MYPIADALKKRFESGERKKAWITLNNASVDGLVITEEDIKADSFSIDRYCATGNKIEIGSAVSSEFSVVLNNSDGKFDGIVFEGSVLCVDVGFAHTTGNYVRCGFFTVDEPPRTFSTISLKALDYMMLYDKTIDRAKLNKAFYTPEELVRSISELCEVEVSDSIEFEKLPSADQSLSIPATATTYRQLLQWVAGITGTCAYIDWDGKLRMSWFVEADTNINITPAFRYSGNVHESDIKITGVTVKTQEATFTDGTETYPLVVEGNGFVYNGTEEHRATSIGSVVKDFTYRPYECTCLPMPYLFPLDRITYTDKSGQEISTVVTNHTFGLNSTSSLAAQGESQQKKSYSGQKGLTKAEVDSAIAEAMKNFDSSTEHFHIMYSAYDKGRDTNGEISWSETPNADTVYLGTCATSSKAKPEEPESYDWVKIKGGDGKPGESPFNVRFMDDGEIPNYVTLRLNSNGELINDEVLWIEMHAFFGNTETPARFGIVADIDLTEYFYGNTGNSWTKKGSATWLYKNGEQSNYSLLRIRLPQGYKPSGDYLQLDFGVTLDEEATSVWDMELHPYYIYFIKDPVSISTVTEKYQVSDSKTDAPTTWEDTAPEMTSDRPYLWNYEVITYSDGSTDDTNARVIGVYSEGEDGKPGRGIASITEYYLVTQTEEIPDEDDFKPTVQTPSETCPFLWNYEVITYDDGSDDYKSEIRLIGVYGKPGGSLQVKYLNSATTPIVANNNVSDWSDTVPAPEKGKKTYMTQKLSSKTNWSTPIQISAEDGTTPTVSIDSSGYWVINGEKTSVKARGENGDTPTITVGANGNWFVDGKDTGTKAQGEQGKDGANIEYVYYRSPSAVADLAKPTYTSGKLPSGWETSPQGITEAYKYEYVSVRTKAAGSTVWSEFSTPVIWSKWGEKGTDGDGIEYKYYLSNSPTAPSYSAGASDWSDDPKGVSATNMYEYVVQITHHGNGTDDSISDVALWSKWGETGVSVVEVITEYHKSTSDSTAPATNSTGWTTEAPLWEDGYYLWTRLKTVFSEGSPQYSTPVVDASWKKVTAVESASKELNETLAGALGLHLTEQKLATSTVRYYHTNPKLENSKSGDTILVLNAQGFGVCKSGWNNGAPDFAYGTTFDGKAVWDILTANKISADLIEAGKLKSVDSATVSSTLNLDTGELLFEVSENKIAVEGPQADEGSSAQGIVDINLSSLYDMGLKLISNSSGERVFLTMSGITLMRVQFVKELVEWARAYALWALNHNNPHPGAQPREPFVQITRELLFSTNIKCDNLSFSPDGGNNYVNMTDFYSRFVLAQESITAMQERIGELETALGQQHTHTNASAIRENVIEATCTSDGSYDSVVYCATCSEEIGRTKITTAALGHSWRDATCTSPKTCTRCGATQGDALGHIDSDNDGYCDRCGTQTGTPTLYYTVNTAVSPSGAGTVTGAGQYKYGTSIYPVATPSSDRYKIKGWLIKDDDTGEVDRSFENIPTLEGIQVNVYSNTTITALFDDTESGGSGGTKTITIASPFSDRGSVEVRRNGSNVTNSENVYTFNVGDTVVITASGANGYDFSRWADGNYDDLWSDNPHAFTVESSSPSQIFAMFKKA